VTFYPRRIFSAMAGFLLAFWLVVGRWSLNRIDADAAIPTLLRPRGWAVVGLVCCAIALLVPYAGSVNRRLGTRVWSPAIVAFLFLSYMCLTAFWTPEATEASQKLVDLVHILLVVVATVIIGMRGDATLLVRVLIRSVIAVTITLAAAGILAALQGDGQRLAVLGGGPNVFGRLMGLLAVWASVRFSQRMRPMPAILAVASVGLLALSGSRGAMISVLVAVVVGQVAATPGKRLAVSGLLVLVVLGVLGLTPLGDSVAEMFKLRFLQLTLGEGYLAHRDEIYRLALDRGLERPIAGWGLASFVSTGWPYAHNVFLEAWSEGGLIGLVLAMASALSGLLAILRDQSEERAVLLGWFVLIVVAAQFSGDIFDSRAMFVLPLLAYLAPSARRVEGRVDRMAA
jgi:O-antigen ligase